MIGGPAAEALGLRCLWLDGAPLLDIKPYMPWADALTDAQCCWAGDRPRGLADLPLVFADGIEKQLSVRMETDQGFAGLLEQTLRADSRPSYQSHETGRGYAMTLANIHVRWRVDADAIVVLELASNLPGVE